MAGAVDTADILIVGAGVIGLAIARKLAGGGKEVIVVEQHDGFGRETSSRNSEVIHCGMYYAEELLKTRLCVRGNPLLYELCARYGIPHRKTGKIVVATDEKEAKELHAILAQGKKNGVPGLRLVGPAELHEWEPNVAGILGLYSPETGIVDSHQLMRFLESDAVAGGAVVAYGCRVIGAAPGPDGHRVEVWDADGEPLSLRAGCLINSAGLHADQVAAFMGIDCRDAGYHIHPCKGEYFKVADRHRGRLRRLVYPTPSPVHLGAHAVLGLDGGLKIGPSSFYVDSIDYAVDESHRADFHEKAVRFLPFLEPGDLTADMAGIRPKLYAKGEPFRDWVIREETDRGLPGFVDLIGMESPGLTSCLAIAEMVATMVH